MKRLECASTRWSLDGSRQAQDISRNISREISVLQERIAELKKNN